MNDTSWALGHKLSNMRNLKGCTLQEAANKIGCTAQFLSMVEKGRSGISFSNLQKLLSFYGFSLADLAEETNDSGRVTHLEQAERMSYDFEGVEAFMLSKNSGKGKPETVYFRLEPNASIGFMEHTGEEILFVIDGVLDISLIDSKTNAEENYTLGKGDTIQHPSTVKHRCTNSSNKVTTFLVTNYV